MNDTNEDKTCRCGHPNASKRFHTEESKYIQVCKACYCGLIKTPIPLRGFLLEERKMTQEEFDFFLKDLWNFLNRKKVTQLKYLGNHSIYFYYHNTYVRISDHRRSHFGKDTIDVDINLQYNKRRYKKIVPEQVAFLIKSKKQKIKSHEYE